jgi:hypothetical protein
MRIGKGLAQQYPNAGRIILLQISAGSAVPLGAVLLLGLPDDPSRSSGTAHMDLYCSSWDSLSPGMELLQTDTTTPTFHIFRI